MASIFIREQPIIVTIQVTLLDALIKHFLQRAIGAMFFSLDTEVNKWREYKKPYEEHLCLPGIAYSAFSSIMLTSAMHHIPFMGPSGHEAIKTTFNNDLAYCTLKCYQTTRFMLLYVA